MPAISRASVARSFNASNYLLAMGEFLREANASYNARRVPGTFSIRCAGTERQVARGVVGVAAVRLLRILGKHQWHLLS